MTYNLPENLKFCGDIVHDMMPLLLYTHIPALVIALTVGAYVLYRTRSRTGVLLFSLALLFALWSLSDLAIWLTYDRNTTMIAIWAVFGILSSFLFLLTHWFTHSFVTEKPLPLWMTTVWGIALSPVIILTPTLLNLSGVDIRNCVAVENPAFTNYYYSLGLLATVLILVSGYAGLRGKGKAEDQARSSKILVLIGAILFVFAFIVTGALASYLVDSGLIPDFGLEQYGVATMAVFMGILAYATVRYHAFNLKLLGAQALVFALVLLISAEFLFVSSVVNRILVAITLGLATIFGYFLVRGVKQEVRQRELIEVQEKELEAANAKQENLLHFISHEIKGYLTKGEAVFAEITEDTTDTIPAAVKTLASGALVEMRKGVATVMDILDASNLKKGTVTFKKVPIDFKALVTKVVEDQRPAAYEKHLGLDVKMSNGTFHMQGDEEKIREHVIRNLIDNAIKYTPAGTVHVELSDGDGKIRFMVADSGVGITPEDMARLFTEGGHGKDSIKVNVHSTGYGLFIAKQVVDAHGGKIWAESEGGGKGSRFFIELPASA